MAHWSRWSNPREDRRHHFQTSLSELVPRAMENISRKKATDTRIWHPGFSQNAAQLQIGNVGAFPSGEKPRSLAIPKLDEIELRASEDGLLIGDLFFDESSSAAKMACLIFIFIVSVMCVQ